MIDVVREVEAIRREVGEGPIAAASDGPSGCRVARG